MRSTVAAPSAPLKNARDLCDRRDPSDVVTFFTLITPFSVEASIRCSVPSHPEMSPLAG